MSVQCDCGSANWVEIATFCCVVIGGLFAWWQWMRSCRVTRAEHLNTVLERYDKKAAPSLFYRLICNASYGGEDSEVFYLGGCKFKEVEDGVSERDIDSMLNLFSQICHERQCGVLSKSEFCFFSFIIKCTLAHKQIKQYLLDFAQHCGRHQFGFPFVALAREGVRVDREHYEQVLAAIGVGKFKNAVKEVLP